MTVPTAASTIAHLLPGFRAASRALRRRRFASLPATTSVPPTHEAMGEAERRAFHAAARAENARWVAVMSTPFPAHLLSAAVAMLSTTSQSAAAISATMEVLGETTPAPSRPVLAPRNGRDRLEARIADQRARAAAAQAAPAEGQAASDADFGRQVARALAKARHPDGPPPSNPFRSTR